jgi:hypothetical protein
MKTASFSNVHDHRTLTRLPQPLRRSFESAGLLRRSKGFSVNGSLSSDYLNGQNGQRWPRLLSEYPAIER